MKIRRFLALIWALAIAAAAVGCIDILYPPAICNGYGHAIEVTYVCTGGVVRTTTLLPYRTFFQRREGLLLQRLTVSMPDGTPVATYSERDLRAGMSAGEKRPFLLLSTNGLTWLSSEEYRAWSDLSRRR